MSGLISTNGEGVVMSRPDYSAILLDLATKAKSRDEENALLLGSRFIFEHTGKGPWSNGPLPAWVKK